jgi:hypothetical protein
LKEKRLDGEIYTLPKFWFYTVDPQGQIHRGNARQVMRADGAHGGPSVEQLEARFGSFEARIKANRETVELDPESKAGLKALGYLP